MTAKNNTWVLITGASSGFGEQFARQYATQGKSLILVARRLNMLEFLAEELRERFKVDVIVEQVDPAVIAAIRDLHHRLQEASSRLPPVLLRLDMSHPAHHKG